MPAPVEWRTVLPYLPQPREAHDAAIGNRKAEVRLWFTPAAENPFAVTMRLIEGDRLVREYRKEYSKMIGRARSGYQAARFAAELWLTGREVQ